MAGVKGGSAPTIATANVTSGSNSLAIFRLMQPCNSALDTTDPERISSYHAGDTGSDVLHPGMYRLFGPKSFVDAVSLSGVTTRVSGFGSPVSVWETAVHAR
jgi:hypothetical protein